MPNSVFPPYLRRGLTAVTALLVAGCGSVSVWPFGESGPAETSRTPANATEYRCDGAKSFYVRPIEGGDVWLIAPDREIRLRKAGAEGRFAQGKVVLQLSGASATLVDPPGDFANCRIPAPPAEKK